MPELYCFGMNWTMIEQIKKWTHHYKKMGLTDHKINGLIERRKRNNKILNDPRPKVNP